MYTQHRQSHLQQNDRLDFIVAPMTTTVGPCDSIHLQQIHTLNIAILRVTLTNMCSVLRCRWCCRTRIWICQWASLRATNEFCTRWFCANSRWIFWRFSTASKHQVHLRSKETESKKIIIDRTKKCDIIELLIWLYFGNYPGGKYCIGKVVRNNEIVAPFNSIIEHCTTHRHLAFLLNAVPDNFIALRVQRRFKAIELLNISVRTKFEPRGFPWMMALRQPCTREWACVVYLLTSSSRLAFGSGVSVSNFYARIKIHISDYTHLFSFSFANGW